MINTLVVGDPHTEPGDDLSRFSSLSKYIIDNQPDNIIFMGDFLSLDSLSHYDMGKPGKTENRRLNKELEVGKEAIHRVEYEILEHNKKRQKNKTKLYKPNKVFLMGNHEDRWNRYLDHHPELRDVLSLGDIIGLTEYDWDIVPYKSYYYINNVAFTHIPMNGANQPISGERMHINAAKDHISHVVYGHTHTLNFTTIARLGIVDERISALNCGWFGLNTPEYAVGSKGSVNWWSGVVNLHHTKDGDFNFSTLSIKTLLEEYN